MIKLDILQYNLKCLIDLSLIPTYFLNIRNLTRILQIALTYILIKKSEIVLLKQSKVIRVLVCNLLFSLKSVYKLTL